MHTQLHPSHHPTFKMEVSFVTLDVFTSTKYAGNPLAIVHVPSSLSPPLTQARKQAIAKEFNLSETVFLHPPNSDDPTTIPIDIFTSVAEISFAGHPTIGTAWYLLHQLKLSPEPRVLRTKAGPIPISATSDTTVSASIPHNIHIHAVTHPHPLLPDEPPCPTVSKVKGMTFILIPLPSLKSLASVKAGIKHPNEVYDPTDLDEGWRTGPECSYYYVLQGTSPDGKQELRTRMFGSREDPATGSAASALCSYLSLQRPVEEGRGPFGFEVVQGVEMGSRSVIEVRIRRTSDGEGVEEVMLGGEAVRVMRGDIEV